MTLEEFVQSVESDEEPPAAVSDTLKALWWAKKGDWDKAHHIAQSVYSPDGSWVHAYLHRVEGDLANAGFWYGRAERHEPALELDEEWAEITEHFLSTG